jgi:hypothetical protein
VDSDASGASQAPKSALSRVVGVLANVAIITALLVYFGWRRSATQSRELGISESILGMSTRDYVLRAVRPVFVLLICLALLALLWVVFDRRLKGQGGLFNLSRTSPITVTRRTRLLRAMRLSLVALPAIALLVYIRWRQFGSILFPATVGAGILLNFYATHLSSPDTSADVDARRRNETRALCTAILVAACLFWTATNYADVEGVRHARAIFDDPLTLPRVLVYSTHVLQLSGPGLQLDSVPGTVDDFRYRYSGLRLLEHNGGNYLLISDGWSAQRGVVIVLPDDDTTLRFEFLTY